MLDDLLSVWRSGGTAGVATVVRTMHSAPRQPGATLVVSPDCAVAGSVAGGCVETAVYDLAHEVVTSGRPQLQRYGVSDDDAFAVGLTCGGIIDILAEPMSHDAFPQLASVAEALDLAHETCDLLNTGGSLQAAVELICSTEKKGSQDDAVNFGGLAVYAYCRQHLPQ